MGVVQTMKVAPGSTVIALASSNIFGLDCLRLHYKATIRFHLFFVIVILRGRNQWQPFFILHDRPFAICRIFAICVDYVATIIEKFYILRDLKQFWWPLSSVTEALESVQHCESISTRSQPITENHKRFPTKTSRNKKYNGL